jgi:hypothetical protein
MAHPAAPAEEGAGRPPEYCEDPTHNRGAAWRARRVAAAVPAGRVVPDDLDRAGEHGPGAGRGSTPSGSAVNELSRV